MYKMPLACLRALITRELIWAQRAQDQACMQDSFSEQHVLQAKEEGQGRVPHGRVPAQAGQGPAGLPPAEPSLWEEGLHGVWRKLGGL